MKACPFPAAIPQVTIYIPPETLMPETYSNDVGTTHAANVDSVATHLHVV